jgi:hypothetical protein
MPRPTTLGVPLAARPAATDREASLGFEPEATPWEMVAPTPTLSEVLGEGGRARASLSTSAGRP